MQVSRETTKYVQLKHCLASGGVDREGGKTVARCRNIAWWKSNETCLFRAAFYCAAVQSHVVLQYSITPPSAMADNDGYRTPLSKVTADDKVEVLGPCISTLQGYRKTTRVAGPAARARCVCRRW